MRRWRAACALTLGLGLAGGVAPEARADEPSPALELFDRGRRLMMNTATLDEACRALEESLKLADRGDTLLNLAECHRRQGKTATAWSEFDKALGVGTKVGFNEAVQAATKLRDQLAAKLSRLTVIVRPETAALPGFTLEVNGKPWPQERWNQAAILDPGPFEVKATAKGYIPFVALLQLGDDKDAKTVALVLQPEPPPPPPPAPPPPPPPKPVVVQKPRPIWPWIVGGLGLALGGVAVGFEVDSRNAGSQLNAKCGSARTMCPVGFDFSSLRARELRGFDLFVGLGAAGVVGIGAAAIGLGLAARSPSRPTVGLVLSPRSIALESTY
jgi:hypothetical protein